MIHNLLFDQVNREKKLKKDTKEGGFFSSLFSSSKRQDKKPATQIEGMVIFFWIKAVSEVAFGIQSKHLRWSFFQKYFTAVNFFAPCISESYIKLKLKFLFSHFFVVPQKVLWSLHKTFWGTTKKCENKNLI